MLGESGKGYGHIQASRQGLDAQVRGLTKQAEHP